MREDDIAARGHFFAARCRDIALGLGEEGVDALHACHRGLDGLNFHAETFNGSKDAGNIADDRDRRTDGHTEKRQDARITRG